MEKQTLIPIWLLDRAIQCLARAEAEGAFKDCAVPNIGAQTLAALESHRKG
jgi:hypothetical protein